MPFLSLFNIDDRFTDRELEQRKYTTTKALSIKNKVKLVNYKKFTTVALDPKKKAFIVYTALLEV